MRQAMFSVDYEGHLGMPWPSASYDIAATTDRLLAVLDRRGVRAVFFVVGRLVQTHPELVVRIAARGHEIGLHGYTHADGTQASAEQRAREFEGTAACIDRLAALTGRRPLGYRSPYLFSPAFYDASLYQELTGMGFRWVSNREVRFPEELLRPVVPGSALLWRRAAKHGFPLYRSALVGLNLPRLVREARVGHLSDPYRWLLSGAAPFNRGELVEWPVAGPLDCDLLGLPRPDESSPVPLLEYASWVLTRMLQSQVEVASVVIHDWLSGSANRLDALDRSLGQASATTEIRWVLPGVDDDVLHLTETVPSCEARA